MTHDYSIETLDSYDDQALIALDWKNLNCLNGRLLELHAEGALGNEAFAKLPRKPILCIDQIDRIDDSAIEATFTFPQHASDWPYTVDEPLEMLFQDQLDQLVGFWGSRKADGIGRALSSGLCELKQSLNFSAGKTIRFRLEKRKWVENQTTGTGTAIFNGRILDSAGEVILETQKIIVGILNPADVHALRDQYGGEQGAAGDHTTPQNELRIPVYDPATINLDKADDGSLAVVSATQQIAPDLWPFLFHFKGDPVVPGNFGTHGMIMLLKTIASDEFGVDAPVFKAMSIKKFSGMIFEDPKQIRFELQHVVQKEDGSVVAAQASLYLEDLQSQRMIEAPIYTYKNLTVSS